MVSDCPDPVALAHIAIHDTIKAANAGAVVLNEIARGEAPDVNAQADALVNAAISAATKLRHAAKQAREAKERRHGRA